MSASEKSDGEPGAGADETGTVPQEGQTPDTGHTVPLFLRDVNEGRKGNAQDEKDETGE